MITLLFSLREQEREREERKKDAKGESDEIE
jgi:hypothetical protein